MACVAFVLFSRERKQQHETKKGEEKNENLFSLTAQNWIWNETDPYSDYQSQTNDDGHIFFSFSFSFHINNPTCFSGNNKPCVRVCVCKDHWNNIRNLSKIIPTEDTRHLLWITIGAKNLSNNFIIAVHSLPQNMRAVIPPFLLLLLPHHTATRIIYHLSIKKIKNILLLLSLNVKRLVIKN